MKVLITGFEPFNGSLLNPSQMLIDAIRDDIAVDVKIEKMTLPVDQVKGPEKLLDGIHQYNPDAILAFGLASGRSRISLEQVAINLMDFRIPDNNGTVIADQPIIADGPAAYFSTLPIRVMHTNLRAEGIPAEISFSAGAFLCNQVFYTMMHEIACHKLSTRAGFIHLPALPEQAAQSTKSVPSMCLDLEIQAVQIMINELQKIQ